MVKIINPKFKQSVGLFRFRFKTDQFLFLIPCLFWEKNYSFRYIFTININVMCINQGCKCGWKSTRVNSGLWVQLRHNNLDFNHIFPQQMEPVSRSCRWCNSNMIIHKYTNAEEARDTKLPLGLLVKVIDKGSTCLRITSKLSIKKCNRLDWFVLHREKRKLCHIPW